MRLFQGPLGALLGLALLVWFGMGISTATVLRRAEVPTARAYAVCLLAWPLVLRRLRQLREDAGAATPGPEEAG
jgi:hypothetical protein